MNPWLTAAVGRVGTDPDSVQRLFAEAGRRVGRVDADAARMRLLAALRLPPARLTEQIRTIYRHGDNDEKRAVLQSLHTLTVGSECVGLLQDALRSNDSRLVAAALGPYAQHLPDPQWRQGVLKAVFMGLPLTTVHGLAQRADAQLIRMLAGLCDERRAAGRALPDDVLHLLERRP